MTKSIDLFDLSKANQPAIAVWCAAHVMEWVAWREAGRCGWSPFTSADDDLTVLKHVRETWGNAMLISFEVNLEGAFGSRGAVQAMNYQTGDYTLSACRVIQGESNATD